MKNIITLKEQLYSSFFIKIGFDIEQSEDSEITFIKDEGDLVKFISIPFKVIDGNIYLSTPTSSIGIPSFEKLVIDLSYESFAMKKDFIATSKWKEEAKSEITTTLFVEADSPSGKIQSLFYNYTIENYFEHFYDSGFVNDFKNYIIYLEKYYEKSVKPFYESIFNLKSLDDFTNNLDLFQLGLYFTKVPPLKKIILMHLNENPNKDDFYNEYFNRLAPHKTSPNVAPIYSSLIKIKDYFSNHPDKTI